MVLQEGFADADAVCVGAYVASITGGVETDEDGVDGADHAGFFGEGVDVGHERDFVRHGD